MKLLLLLLLTTTVSAQIPRSAETYKRPLIANAHAIWGLSAPVAVFAAQIHQESGWRPDAKSAYASGLAQFTPATAEWIGTKYADLATAQPFSPSWALRALVRYDQFLYDRVPGAASACHRWAFTLSGYNGGEGWRVKDQQLAKVHGADPLKWWGSVEYFSPRAVWAFTENRNYPRKILLVHQPLYLGWGLGVDCQGVA